MGTGEKGITYYIGLPTELRGQAKRGIIKGTGGNEPLPDTLALCPAYSLADLPFRAKPVLREVEGRSATRNPRALMDPGSSPG